jgi:hypothetical protein
MTDRYPPFRLTRAVSTRSGRPVRPAKPASSATRARHGRASAWRVHDGIDLLKPVQLLAGRCQTECSSTYTRGAFTHVEG